jgi:hypothetical protein
MAEALWPACSCPLHTSSNGDSSPVTAAGEQHHPRWATCTTTATKACCCGRMPHESSSQPMFCTQPLRCTHVVHSTACSSLPCGRSRPDGSCGLAAAPAQLLAPPPTAPQVQQQGAGLPLMSLSALWSGTRRVPRVTDSVLTYYQSSYTLHKTRDTCHSTQHTAAQHAVVCLQWFACSC